MLEFVADVRSFDDVSVMCFIINMVSLTHKLHALGPGVYAGQLLRISHFISGEGFNPTSHMY